MENYENTNEQLKRLKTYIENTTNAEMRFDTFVIIERLIETIEKALEEEREERQ